MGTIITIGLTAGIGWWVTRIISRQAKAIKSGKCAGCAKECSTCNLPIDFTE